MDTYLEGTRISLFIAFLAATLDLVIGVAYGSISAYYGGRIDNVMQRIIEVLMGIPNLIVVILLILVLKPGILSITLAMVITGWVSMARIIRGQVLKLKGQEFVLASRTLGANDKRLNLGTSNTELIRPYHYYNNVYNSNCDFYGSFS